MNFKFPLNTQKRARESQVSVENKQMRPPASRQNPPKTLFCCKLSLGRKNKNHFSIFASGGAFNYKGDA